MPNLDDQRIIKPAREADHKIELRGRSGRLYGMLDRERMVIEIKRNEKIDTIDLRYYLEPAKP